MKRHSFLKRQVQIDNDQCEDLYFGKPCSFTLFLVSDELRNYDVFTYVITKNNLLRGCFPMSE